LDAVDAKTTGRVETTCGHVFHFKCLTSWFSKQAESSCPMCRQKATEFEDFAQEDEDAGGVVHVTGVPVPFTLGSDAGEEDEEEESALYLSRIAMDAIIRHKGGIGVIADVDAEVGFDEMGYATITRSEFERITHEQGCTPFSDGHWNQLRSIYPSYEAPDGPLVSIDAPPRLTFGVSQPEASPPPMEYNEDDLAI
jgi:hypothetical protein